MKKYSVFNLYVVEIKNGDDVHFLICKHNDLSNVYIEVFTNEKIKVPDISNIKPLSDYYSLLTRCNYITGEPLMLDKKALLKKYIAINSEASLKKEQEPSESEDNIANVNGVLEKATLNFFPKEGVWYSHCFGKPKDLSMGNLPCHLRDDLWLARMLKQEQQLFYMSTNTVLKFIKTSPLFQEKRHEYEQKIVKWQIDWIKNGGENWVCDEKLGGDLCMLLPTWDIAFRKGVVDTLTRIGMSLDAIEEGLERNANVWRNLVMLSAFRNEYEPLIPSFLGYFGQSEEPKEERQILESVDPKFEENWLKMRKYEYYQRHKDSVDKYGVVEPDMLLSDEQVAELKLYLEQKHKERMSQIEKYKQEISGTQGQTRTLKNRYFDNI